MDAQELQKRIGELEERDAVWADASAVVRELERAAWADASAVVRELERAAWADASAVVRELESDDRNPHQTKNHSH